MKILYPPRPSAHRELLECLEGDWKEGRKKCSNVDFWERAWTDFMSGLVAVLVV